MEQKKRIYVNNEQVELALQIALDAHKGQVDLDGKPAILHALAVGLAGENLTEICVGYLHDVVEDSNITFNDLRERGVALKIIRALEVLTHDKSVPYMDYIRSIEASGNKTALKVKIKGMKTLIWVHLFCKLLGALFGGIGQKLIKSYPIVTMLEKVCIRM